MPSFGPVKRKDLIRYFRKLGFDGPFSGTRHQFMIKDAKTIRIPNPHQSDVGKELLSRILRQAGINKDEWESL
ncbi:type II toxin-antitoxin system HicA family toxin [bacterium]|nr:type II toxin-antitoxin system HicA family toxin [bacterium]